VADVALTLVVGAAVRTAPGAQQAAQRTKAAKTDLVLLCGFCFLRPMPAIQDWIGHAVPAFGVSQTISKSALILDLPHLNGDDSLCGCKMH
jgi:hypothetical protein